MMDLAKWERRCKAAEDRARRRCTNRAEIRVDAQEIREMLAEIKAYDQAVKALRELGDIGKTPGVDVPQKRLDASELSNWVASWYNHLTDVMTWADGAAVAAEFLERRKT